MTRARIAIASLGGTITMTSTQPGSGVRPSLSAADLLAAVPQLAESAEIETTTLTTVPGASLTFATLLDVLGWARSAIDSGAAGAVVVQGTDTIEETAYFLDLHWDRPEPLIVTGAMRSAQAPGADGPANLLASVQTAGAAESRDRGVLVVMNDQIHSAVRVRKLRSSGPDAFGSPGFGPLGFVEEGRARYGSRADRPAVLATAPRTADPKVALLETVVGDDGALLDAAIDSGFVGVVIQGFGVGHVSEPLAARIEEATASVPVVLASRTGAGTTYTGTYGFVGSESDLIARGIIPSGWLDGRKARILLWCLLSAGAGLDVIRAEFESHGRLQGAADRW